jgi:hypothetical protein
MYAGEMSGYEMPQYEAPRMMAPSNNSYDSYETPQDYENMQEEYTPEEY